MPLNKCKCGCGAECKTTYMHGHNQRGKKRSPEAISKMKKKLLDPEFNKEWRKALSAGWTNESKEALRKFNKGKTLSQDHRVKIGEGNKGKVRKDNVKERISKNLRGRFIGELNPFYKHGQSNKNKIARQTFEYKQWRKSVFDRDNYTCKDCGINGVYVTAHHIKSFAYYPELRYDVSNGVTLCEGCHSKTDNYKGRAKHKLKTS